MTETTGSERPTFESAFAAAEAATAAPSASAADSQAANPAETAPVTDQPAAATAQPATETPAVGDDGSAPGVPPEQRWPTILKNAREKAAAEARAALEGEWAPYARLRQFTPQQIQEWTDASQRLSADPVGFVTELLGELRQHPQYGPQVVSQAARLLSTMRGQVSEAEPEPDLMAENGTPVYSAPQLKKWQQWNQARTLAAFEERLQPLTQAKEQFENVQQAQRAQEWSQNMLTDAREHWHGFKDHEADVRAVLEQHPEYGADLRRAYHDVLTTKILPGMTEAGKQQALAELKHKATAATINPAAAQPVTPKRPKTFEEAFRQAGLEVDL